MAEKEIIVVEGNNALAGEVQVSGAKNSALKLIAAAILGQGKSTLHNVPYISDIVVMSEVLECLGATVERTDHTMTIDTTAVESRETPYELVSKMRASISVLGPLIALPCRAAAKSVPAKSTCTWWAWKRLAWNSTSTTAT